MTEDQWSAMRQIALSHREYINSCPLTKECVQDIALALIHEKTSRPIDTDAASTLLGRYDGFNQTRRTGQT